MSTRIILTSTMAILLGGCQAERATPVESRTEAVREDAVRAAREMKAKAEEAKAALSKRLDRLDEKIDELEAKAKKASAKTKAKMNEQAREMRAEAKKLRARMSTWDDKAESAWQTVKREVEEGLAKTEKAIEKIVDDIKK